MGIALTKLACVLLIPQWIPIVPLLTFFLLIQDGASKLNIDMRQTRWIFFNVIMSWNLLMSKGVLAASPVEHAQKASPAKITVYQSETLAQIQLALKLTDNIARESVPILAPNIKVSRTPFGRAFQAMMTLEKGTTDGVGSDCQTYHIQESPGAIKVFLSCEKNRRLPFFDIVWNKQEKTLRIYAEALRNIIGDSASILGKAIECEFDQKESLKSYTCHNYYLRIDEKTVLAFDTIRFERDRDSLVTLKGKWLDQLFPVKSFEALVPQRGKIKVTEKILFSPKPKKSDASLQNSGQNSPDANTGGLDAKEKDNKEKNNDEKDNKKGSEKGQQKARQQNNDQIENNSKKSNSENGQGESDKEGQGKANETNIETEQNQYERPRGGR